MDEGMCSRNGANKSLYLCIAYRLSDRVLTALPCIPDVGGVRPDHQRPCLPDVGGARPDNDGEQNTNGLAFRM